MIKIVKNKLKEDVIDEVSTKVLLEKQMKNELENSVKYNQVTCELNNRGLNGLAKWFSKGADDEYFHFKKIMNYMIDVYDTYNVPFEANGLMISLGNEPLYDLCNQVYDIEKRTTRELTSIKERAFNEGDQKTAVFMNKMIEEQIEEEAKMLDLMDLLKIANNNSAGILQIDREYGMK